MVRAVILGLLMPASDDPRRDRDVFLALLTMDDEGLWQRKRRNIPLKDVYHSSRPESKPTGSLPPPIPIAPKLRRGIKAEEKKRLQRLVFDRMNYDEKLAWCDRPGTTGRSVAGVLVGHQ